MKCPLSALLGRVKKAGSHVAGPLSETGPEYSVLSTETAVDRELKDVKSSCNPLPHTEARTPRENSFYKRTRGLH